MIHHKLLIKLDSARMLLDEACALMDSEEDSRVQNVFLTSIHKVFQDLLLVYSAYQLISRSEESDDDE